MSPKCQTIWVCWPNYQWWLDLILSYELGICVTVVVFIVARCLITPGVQAGGFSHINCASLLLPFPSSQLPVEVTSQVQREPCYPQTIHIITPEARAVFMTSLSRGTMVSNLSIISSCRRISIQLPLMAHLKCCCPGIYHFTHEVGGGADK